jgi:hypothetical protein
MIRINEYGFPYESHSTLQELSYKVKDLRKLFNKESQPALKRYYERLLTKAEKIHSQSKRNDSGLKPMRTPWARNPQVKYDSTSN